MDDFDDDDDETTVPCPYCKREIHEDSQRCPYCERYISDEDAPAGRKPWWIVAGVIVCLYIALRWIAG
jgi:ferredoxin-thioredoxin reductase catalytic subunit